MVKLSVLMAVHNGMPYLTEAIESILSQTFKDFEFILVDDFSSDGSAQLMIGVRDNRVRLIRNKKQLGLSRSLNKGLTIAEGKYVARMDADDISLPERFAAQYSFLEAHANIDVLGTWTKTLGLSSDQVWRYPTDDAQIRAEMLFNSVLVHSSVMLRRSTFVKYRLCYGPNVAPAQDYELWARAMDHLHFANLDMVLHRYRIHPQQVGMKQGAIQQTVAAKVRLRQIKALGLRSNQINLHLHNSISQWVFPVSHAGLLNIECWLFALSEANRRTMRYPNAELNSVLERRWWAACRGAVDLGLIAWNIYIRSRLAFRGERSNIDKVVFWAKAFVRERTQ